MLRKFLATIASVLASSEGLVELEMTMENSSASSMIEYQPSLRILGLFYQTIKYKELDF